MVIAGDTCRLGLTGHKRVGGVLAGAEPKARAPAAVKYSVASPKEVVVTPGGDRRPPE